MSRIATPSPNRPSLYKRWSARLAGAGLSLLLLAACASSGGATPPGGAQPDAPGGEPVAARTLSLPEWIADIRAEALRLGIRSHTVDTAFANVRILDRVLELDQTQPEFSRQVWAYLDSAVSEDRVNAGKARIAASRELLARVSTEYGVPAEILVAFWGVESDYGHDYGSWSVIDALTTLAYKSRRPAFFRGELLAALRILDNGDIAPDQLRGSWAGAMGQTQFIPTIFLKHAVDYDGDGKRDIWTSLPDVFASTAHFVKIGNGWRTGESWGEEVKVPADFPWDQAEYTIQKPVAEWLALGVRSVSGAPLADYGSAAILAPGGHTGPVFLLRENFRAIMRYNPSTSYSLAVALLADRMAGGGRIVTPWPRQEEALSRTERQELQERLAALGLASGKADALIGPNTRTAIRSFQKSLGEVPDGFATKRLLGKLRARMEGHA